MLFLVDNPGSLLVRTRKVLAAALEKPGDFQMAAYKRQPGHPVYIPARAFEGILSWTGENGLRGFIAQSGIRSHAVATGQASALHDVDTPAELEKIRNPKHRA
jgi:CTP:molybdopterin cytidylyltransferase MocA